MQENLFMSIGTFKLQNMVSIQKTVNNLLFLYNSLVYIEIKYHIYIWKKLMLFERNVDTFKGDV